MAECASGPRIHGEAIALSFVDGTWTAPFFGFRLSQPRHRGRVEGRNLAPVEGLHLQARDVLYHLSFVSWVPQPFRDRGGWEDEALSDSDMGDDAPPQRLVSGLTADAQLPCKCVN